MKRHGPLVFPSPFDALGPHPLAREAAHALQEELRGGLSAEGLATAVLTGADGGKMFGVLVAQDASGRRSVLRAFSGLLAGSFHHAGWSPPAFDVEARALVEPCMEAAIPALTERRDALRSSRELNGARALHERILVEQAEAREALSARHRARRSTRAQARAAIDAEDLLAPCARPDQRVAREQALQALAQQSRGDKAEKRRLLEAQATALAPIAQRRHRLERKLAALERLRAHVSRTGMRAIHDTYRLTNARGEQRGLTSLFGPQVPPSGAGDCAGVKLLVHALALGLTPLAMAEFWWGPPPPAGGRVHGAFYPACREKCGPLLPFLLEGLHVSPPRHFAPAPSDDLPLRIVYEDAHVVAVDKPSGLLSVPGRGALLDSVLTRLRARYPGATGPLLVHRLDLDTSGLMLAALDATTHTALQRQFLARGVQKRYRALLEGIPPARSGEVSFPLRADVDDRPRQIHDPVHGRAALTRYEVVRTAGARAEVSLWPVTGRTHQLRVHASHPLGLGAPIVGDRLYGHAASRLMLHAERLELRHPATGSPLVLEVPAPFGLGPGGVPLETGAGPENPAPAPSRTT